MHTISDLVEMLNLNRSSTRISDHSVLYCNLNLYDIDTYEDTNTALPNSTTENMPAMDSDSNTGKYSNPPQRFKNKQLPEIFMSSEDRVSECAILMDRLLQERQTLIKLDALYDDVITMYFNEMSQFLQAIKQTPKSKRAISHTKNPFWDEELSLLWKQFHEAERTYLKACRKDHRFEETKMISLENKKNSDRTLRKKTRSYQRKKVYELEEINTTDPNKFWDCIKKLGPKKVPQCPGKCTMMMAKWFLTPKRYLKNGRLFFVSYLLHML